MAKIILDNPSTVSPQCPTIPDNALTVTPTDADTFSQPTMIYVGVAGTLSVVPAGSGPIVSVTAIAGAVLPFRVLQVRATGTTATGLIAVY